MSSWSKRRKLLYLSVVLIIVIGVVVIPAFLLLYHAPTCSDGIKNGNEEGVDCGGSCERLCQTSFAPATVAWTRFEKVTPSLYNVASYVVNPNVSGEAVDVPYKVDLYDKDGGLILEQSSTVTLPPHRNTLAFIPSVNVGKQIPAHAVFAGFTAAPNWHKQGDQLSALEVMDKKYTEDANGSALQVTLQNDSVNPLPRMTVYAVLYEQSGNALGFSKTVIDSIPGQGTVIAPYTWPANHGGKVVSIEILPVAQDMLQ